MFVFLFLNLNVPTDILQLIEVNGFYIQSVGPTASHSFSDILPQFVR